MEEEKPCAVCGRRIEWRRKWKTCWAQVKYCSAGCRKQRVGPRDREIEREILGLLVERARSATICPSEVARSLFSDNWRERMEEVRRAARRLVARGEVEITQRGTVVDASTAAGPIRLRLVNR